MGELPAVKTESLQGKFLETFLNCCCDFFKGQCQIDLVPDGMSVFEPSAIDQEVDLTASVGVTSEKFKGNVTLAFNKETFLKIASGMLGEEYTEINEENEDLGSEVLNMIFGQAKAKFAADHGVKLQPAIPAVISGKNLKLKGDAKDPTMILPFKSDSAKMFCLVTLSEIR